jgi:tetratricopeptide (TPR) repeat protein
LTTIRAPSLERRLFRILALVALVYALLAGLRTVSDFDTGWQLATGRWVAQHHRVFSTDVFSYTAYGQPWIYPAGAGLLFYWAYLLGGYVLLSWMGATACATTVALLLRRGSAVSAGLAILAVPLIAYRTVPRADLFTVVLFAAYLSILWQHFQTGRARLWLLPLLMVAWVNLHLGFAAGLGLIVAFMGVDVLEMLFPGERREQAMQRLKRETIWLAASALATLVNPWGWGIYQALIRQDRAMAQHAQWLTEWFGLPLNWASISTSISLRNVNGAAYVVLAVMAVAALLALLERQPGAAVLLIGAAYQTVRHQRMEALTGCVAVVVGGSVLFAAVSRFRSSIPNLRVRSALAVCAAALMLLLACVRSADVVSNRNYFFNTSVATFGAGVGWWFPVRAAEFIARENVPGQIFNTYEEGGFLSWQLGPKYPDYIDGRAIPFGPALYGQQERLQQTSLDSDLWKQEANRYNINAFILPLARFQLVAFSQLKDFCKSRDWRPVYLDELAAVFVRRTPETESLIQRSAVDCAAVTLPAAPVADSPGISFNQWANAAGVLTALNRWYEALSASDKALHIFPDSPYLHWLRGNIFYGMGRRSEAEPEFVAAVKLDPNEVTWSSLGTLYHRQGRIPEATHAMEKAVQLSPQPHFARINLAQYYLDIVEPAAAVRTLDEAVRMAPAAALKDTGKGSFSYSVAYWRAAAWRRLGDLNQATKYEEEAVRIDPGSAEAWASLAQLYEQQGRVEDQHRAQQHATDLATSPAK